MSTTAELQDHPAPMAMIRCMDTPTLSWCKAVACSKFRPWEYTLKSIAPLVHRCRSGSRTPPCSGRRRPACRHWPGSAHRLGHRLQTRSRQLATRPPETGLTMAMAFLQRSFRLFRRCLLRHAPGAVPCSCALYGIRGNAWGSNRSACRQGRLLTKSRMSVRKRWSRSASWDIDASK